MRILTVAAFLFFSGCAWEHWNTYPKSQYRVLDLSGLKIGMTEKEVRLEIGDPYDVIGSRSFEDGHVVKVLQYLEVKFMGDIVRKNYYLYFADGELVQWGRPGDWREQANEIYEVRFRRSQGEIP